MSSATNAAERARAQRRVRLELLTGLIGKDLKVKYQGSFLGFLWSLANPLVLLVVYTFVFGVVLGSGIPRFGYYLLSGLLVWNAFSGSVAMATDSVVANAGLVKKVHFPLGVLPLTAIGFNAVHFCLQSLVLVAAMLVTGDTHFLGLHLVLVLPAILVGLVFTSALSFLVAALNVRYRDTKHLVEIVLMAGFWVSPIVYSVTLVRTKLEHHRWIYDLYLLNPMTSVVMAMQRALYAENPTMRNGKTAVVGQHALASDGIVFYLSRLGIAFVLSLALLALGLTVYRRMSADFAEEL